MVQSSHDTESTHNGQKSAERREATHGDGESRQGGASGSMVEIGDAIEERKARAAGALRDVAQTVRERASNAPVPGLDRAAEAAARPLESGATYLEQHTPSDMWTDLMQFCRSHPAGALFLGFSLGYMVKKLLP